MSKANVLESIVVAFADGRYKAKIRVFEVPKSLKFPDGYKVNCVLLDTNSKTVLLVLDNHQPFGYHIHTELPHNRNARMKIDVKTYEEAIKSFFKEVRRLTNEKK